MTGARLIIARPEGHKDPSYLRALIEETGVTTLHFVPSMLQSFLDSGPTRVDGSVRQIVCSGEELPVALQVHCLQRMPHARLSNLYGPTEAAIDVTYWECRLDEEPNRVPIGRPISNTQIYILDRYQRPAPIGVEGEIYIGGAGVARGYLNRRELTAERFVADPFSDKAGARLYRTGDLGRWRADGNIEFLGRNDAQVKIRGFRIELGEIESQLGRHPQVREAVVLAREDVPGEKRLVAYFTSTQDAPDIESLRAHLQQQLPGYMVPAAYVHLESVPLTPNGKVDRKRLPAPEGQAYQHQVYEAPEGEIEQQLAQIWQELLQVERVGRHDNFFELGGHSLLAVRLVERMRQHSLHTDIRALFNAPTLWQLAEQMDREETGVRVPPNLIPEGCEGITPEMLPLIELQQSHIDQIISRVPGGAGNVQDIYPLAPLQEGILFHHLMAKQGDAYLLPSLLAFDTRERLERFIAVMSAVIERHDILRTAVMWEGLPQPVQVVWRAAPLPVQEVQLESGDGARQLRERFDPRHYRLDVRQAPLQRVFIAYEQEQARWLLLMLSHHLAIDHATLETIFGEVQA